MKKSREIIFGVAVLSPVLTSTFVEFIIRYIMHGVSEKRTREEEGGKIESEVILTCISNLSAFW